MPMPGTDFKVTREAILDAYSEDDLRMTLRDTMAVSLDRVVGPGSLETRVFNLLEWAERHGREAELIRATANSRPRNTKLQEVSAKYGLGVEVEVRRTGTTANTGSGFERTVRTHIPLADIAVWREQITAIEGRVCQITFRGQAQGTGFLVGPDAVLTNYHVLEPVLKGAVSPTVVECVFDFKKLPNGTKQRTPVALHPSAWEVDSSPYAAAEKALTPELGTPTVDELDYAVVKLAEPTGAKPWAANPGGGAAARGWVRVPDDQPEFESPMGLIIAQHPNGWPMKLGMDTTAIDQAAIPPLWLNSACTRVRYAINTDGGSSGSPVFDLNWNLVALHHYGDPDLGHQADWNQGVPIGLIRDRLTHRNKQAALGGDPT